MAISALLGVCLGTRAGASTPEGAMMLPGRACVVRGSRDRLHYLVIDGQLPKTAFKNHADHVFVGLSQMGGCPSEFVDCWNPGAIRARASGEAPLYMLVPRRPAHAWHAWYQ